MNDLPTLRAFASREAGREIGIFMVEVIQRNRDMFRSCLNCAAFVESHQWCGKFAAYPPPRVVVYACPGYEDKDEIPF